MTCHARAHTSLALIENQSTKSWFVSAGYDSQQEAGQDAAEGCRVTARQRGIANLAKTCKVVARALGPGYGAMACAEGGCSWSMGHDTAQAAIDAAYELCLKNYAKCQDADIPTWSDAKGFAVKPSTRKPQAAADCRPRTNHLQCTSSCKNGSCMVTYENGCKVPVQVQPQFNPMTNAWDYPAPSC